MSWRGGSPTPAAQFAGRFENCPRKIALRSGLCVQADLESIEYAYWLDQLGTALHYHRKLWELAYVCQVAWQTGSLAAGKRGLGFAVGTEELPSYFAARGVKVHATDAPAHLSLGWADTNQHAATLESVFRPKLISRELFDRNVSFEPVDMNRIPDSLRDFDFCWSICALEHLGSLRHGADFVLNSLKTLRSGGYAIHTMEYNVSSNDRTLDHASTVVFRRQDLERIAEQAARLGHEVTPLDFSTGRLPLDEYVDLPPFAEHAPQLKLLIREFACTSFGLVIRKK
ncbi:MAG: hypothetical protein WDO13_11240 [Verrucomicrobiota bacterium]